MKPFYRDSHFTLYVGDMRRIVPRLSGAAILTDPPYEETKCRWDRWPAGWPSLCIGVAPQLWCFGSMRLFLEKFPEFAGWQMSQDLVWEKHNGSMLRNDRFRRVHELMLHFYRGSWKELGLAGVCMNDALPKTVRRNHKPRHWGSLRSSASYKTEQGGPRLLRSVIHCRSCHKRAEHETEKPVELVMPLIQYSTQEGDTIIDPFCGSGAFLEAAFRLGRNAIGIEADERIAVKTARRLKRLASGGVSILPRAAAFVPSSRATWV